MTLARFIRMRVSRRLFVLFVLSAFAPLAVIAILSLSQVRSLLLQQGEQRLSATAKSYGMTLFERLLFASDIATSAAASRKPVAANDTLATRAFSSLGVVTAGGTLALLGSPQAPVLGEEAQGRLALGKPLVILAGEGKNARLTMVSPLPASSGIVVGVLRPEFVWGLEDELPTATEFCVLEESSKRLLYCSAPLVPATLGAMKSRTSSGFGSAVWKRGDETFRSRAWTQFMRAGFGTPDWVVIASQAERYQLARVLEFRNTYIPVVALALLLATWLTIRQARNIVDPVERLAERARGVANNDFQSRLALARDDEFGELANAFDQMSERLGRQFASLRALSEIDRLILATQDTVQIVRTVLHRVGDVIPADVVSITLIDTENSDHARTYFRPADAKESMSMERHGLLAAERAAFSVDGQGQWLPVDDGGQTPAYLGHLPAYGLTVAYVQPIVWRGEVCGALSLGFRAAVEVTDEERQQVRELADRVAVAMSSAWRDEKLYLQTHFDVLTGLPNRLLFKDRLEREIARSQREKLTFALLFIDLDHFKNVNDSFGHTFGDGVLRESADRIGGCTRDSDTVSRLGGDEFTVMLTRLNNAQDAWPVAEAIVEALSHEFSLGEQQCFLSASVGIASFPADGATAEELLKSADTAMYRAKEGGRSQVVFFEENMNREAVARVTLDRDLRAAIDRGELVLHYQPQLHLGSGAILGAEALLRWNHPRHGLISPLRFIPLAEESGFIEQIGQWTLQEACAQMRVWRAAGLPMERVSVNVSPRQFRKRNLVSFVRKCVSDAGLPPSCLDLEITEGLLVDRGEAVEGMLRELAEMGHRIALDDFGTGFSSMSYLTRFPVDTIKVDRVFVDGLGRSTDAEAIVAAIIAMSHALGKDVIAEGVETEEQLEILRRLRCDEIQGFLLSPALPPDEFEALLASRSPATIDT